MTQAAAPDTARPPRTLSREARRAQIIESTIQTLATRGFARTTLTEVARSAGLSHGLVLFHFDSKEGLLTETLAYLAEEYRQNWQAALDAAARDPASRLAALIAADFSASICTPDRLSAWCAFWGEAQSRPLYQESCGEKDAAYNTTMEGICADLIAEGGYCGNPIRMARILRVTIEGTWMDLMTMEQPYSVAEALATAHACAALLFPRHFTPPA